MILDTSTLDYRQVYKIMIASVAPRPIAWVGSRSKSGIDNLAPYSFYNAFSSNPPIVGFSAIPREDGSNKDSLQNVIETGCFTLNCVSHKLVKQMSKSSALLAPEVDEFDYAGLEKAQATHINAPCVADAQVIFECKLNQIVNFGSAPGSGNLVLGEIMFIHVDDEIYQDGRIDQDKLDPVGRLAGNWYSTTRDKFELERG